MDLYHHRQAGRMIVWPMVAISIAIVLLAFLVPGTLGGAILAIPLMLVAWMFSRLTISIDSQTLRARFGPGFFGKTVALADIIACEPVRIQWWEGWGIHLSRFGWLYNVSGWDAVVIRLRDGKQFALGTDQPNELTSAIRLCASVK